MITTIDLEYLGAAESIASYLLRGPDGPVLVETGPGCTTDALEAGLARNGLAPADVGDVLVTHIHFDHAGAAGWMARHGATIHVHEFGAKHLVRPERLVASARRIYGERMDELWGEIIPVPESRVRPVHDGDVVEAGGLRLRAIETPGHARHHHAFALDTADGRVAFTGDAAATSVAACRAFISVPMPPPEFDLEAWIASIGRLQRQRFDRIYPTHFGPLDRPADHLARLERELCEHVDFVRDLVDDRVDHATIAGRYLDWFVGRARAAGFPESHMGFYVKDSIAGMNVAGIERYLAKQAELSV